MAWFPSWKEALHAELPPGGPVTSETVECVRKHSQRHRGSVRMSNGRIWTDQEMEYRRSREYQRPLP